MKQAPDGDKRMQIGRSSPPKQQGCKHPDEANATGQADKKCNEKKLAIAAFAPVGRRDGAR
jgi:hypothetical protein